MIKAKKGESIKVIDLIKFLLGCKFNADIFTTSREGYSLFKVKKIVNHGNYVELIEHE